MIHILAALPLIFGSTVALAAADNCPQPVYRSLNASAVMRFTGDTGEMVYAEHGFIEVPLAHRKFKFSTTHSNGFSREYIEMELPGSKAIDSVVLRKNANFSAGVGPSQFLIIPDLPVNLYYATNQEGQEALHAIRLDDTWKLVGCRGKIGLH